MKSSEAERLAKIIQENSRPVPARLKTLAPQPTVLQANEARLRQMKRQFDERYRISTPPELMNFSR